MATTQYSVSVRNAKLNAIETDIGTAPILELRTGGLPANCAAAASGTLLAQAAIPSDWMGAAAAGVKSKAGTWTLTGLASGSAGYFRIYRAGSPSDCDIQGDVTATGGGGAMTMDNISIAPSQTITVNTFAVTAGQA